MPWKNPEKRREYNRKYNRDWYQRNKGRIIKQVQIQKKKNRHRKKKMLVDMLGGKCTKCGYNKCLGAMEFHHPDNNKEAAISTMLSRGDKLEDIIEEAKKCKLVCSNCHREIEYENVE